MTNDRFRSVPPPDYLAGYNINNVPATPTVRAAALSALAETDAVLLADIPSVTFEEPRE